MPSFHLWPMSAFLHIYYQLASLWCHNSLLKAVCHWGNILATCSMLHCWTSLAQFHWFSRRQHVACNFVRSTGGNKLPCCLSHATSFSVLPVVERLPTCHGKSVVLKATKWAEAKENRWLHRKLRKLSSSMGCML